MCGFTACCLPTFIPALRQLCSASTRCPPKHACSSEQSSPQVSPVGMLLMLGTVQMLIRILTCALWAGCNMGPAWILNRMLCTASACIESGRHLRVCPCLSPCTSVVQLLYSYDVFCSVFTYSPPWANCCGTVPARLMSTAI